MCKQEGGGVCGGTRSQHSTSNAQESELDVPCGLVDLNSIGRFNKQQPKPKENAGGGIASGARGGGKRPALLELAYVDSPTVEAEALAFEKICGGGGRLRILGGCPALRSGLAALVFQGTNHFRLDVTSNLRDKGRAEHTSSSIGSIE